MVLATTGAKTTETTLLTAEDLLRLYSEGVRGELVRGVLCETMPTGGEHSEIVANLVIEMGQVIKANGLGRISASDAGVLLEREPDTVREPDIAFFSVEKIARGVRVRGYYEVVPDIVVEVASPSDSAREVNDKARMWLSYGVRLVWVVYPDARRVDVHPQSGAMQTLTDGDTLDGGDVLPGFAYAVADVFDAV